MPAIVSTAGRLRPLMIAAVVVVLALAGTLALWAYYGTAVFFEILRAGWAACF
jgi:hypothetical protein